MTTRIFVVTVSIVACLCGSGLAQTREPQWLIEGVQGKWKVLVQNGTSYDMAKYEILTLASKIQCIAAPCVLTAYSLDTAREEEIPLSLPVERRLGQVVSIKLPVAGKTAGVQASADAPVPRSFQALMNNTGFRAGRTKGTGDLVCRGELPLASPICGETIDVTDFSLRWTPRPSEAGKVFTLFVGGADSSERKRWNSVSADAGDFRVKALNDYLTSLELPDSLNAVSIRLMRTESLDAIRLVNVPSKADDAEYRKRLQAISSMPDLPRTLWSIEETLKMKMWSKAALISQQLLRDAPDSLEIRKYALAGLCQSDMADEIARLRNSLKDAGVTGVCDAEEKK